MLFSLKTLELQDVTLVYRRQNNISATISGNRPVATIINCLSIEG